MTWSVISGHFGEEKCGITESSWPSLSFPPIPLTTACWQKETRFTGAEGPWGGVKKRGVMCAGGAYRGRESAKLRPRCVDVSLVIVIVREYKNLIRPFQLSTSTEYNDASIGLGLENVRSGAVECRAVRAPATQQVQFLNPVSA